MGLIRCLDCDNWVSYNADCCPNYGNKRFREQWTAREERWEKERKEKQLKEKETAKQLGYANVEDFRLAMKRDERRKERLDWWIENSSGILILLGVLGAIIWYYYF
jgi:hypothetical protein